VANERAWGRERSVELGTGRRPRRTRAYLLRAIDYRDADRIVTLLTRDFGRLSAVARNARRSRKRFGGSLESFMELDVELRWGRGDLATLGSAAVAQAHLGLVADLRRMRCAGACLELVRLLAPEREPEPRLFEAVGAMLETIEASAPEEAADRGLSFCARALAIVGWAPDLETCGVTGRRCPPEQPAFFDPKRGTIVARSAGGGPLLLHGDTRRTLRASFEDPSLRIGWSPRARQEAADAIRGLVRAHLDRELSSAWARALGG